MFEGSRFSFGMFTKLKRHYKVTKARGNIEFNKNKVIRSRWGWKWPTCSKYTWQRLLKFWKLFFSLLYKWNNLWKRLSKSAFYYGITPSHLCEGIGKITVLHILLCLYNCCNLSPNNAYWRYFVWLDKILDKILV